MNREGFLDTLEYFDNNFNVLTVESDKGIEFAKYMDERKKEARKVKHSHIFSHVDIASVRQITQGNDNCFTPFYNLEREELYIFFEMLSNTEFGLIMFNDFSEKYKEIKKITEINRSEKRLMRLWKCLVKIVTIMKQH